MIFDYLVMPSIFLVVGILLAWLSIRRMISLAGKPFRLWRKIVERILLSVVALVAAMPSAAVTTPSLPRSSGHLIPRPELCIR